MYSNGKFKNVVALLSSREGCPLGPGASLRRSYTLRPMKSSTKNWIALEDSYMKAGATLASTVVCPGNGAEDRNVFAIYVSYYVKVMHVDEYGVTKLLGWSSSTLSKAGPSDVADPINHLGPTISRTCISIYASAFAGEAANLGDGGRRVPEAAIHANARQRGARSGRLPVPDQRAGETFGEDERGVHGVPGEAGGERAQVQGQQAGAH